MKASPALKDARAREITAVGERESEREGGRERGKKRKRGRYRYIEREGDKE